MNIAEQLPLTDHEEQLHTYTMRNVILLAIGTLIGLALFMRVRTAIGMRSGNQTTINKKRNFNKRWNNRFTMTIGRAGQPLSIFALVHHRGRHSGKSYTTPVRSVPVEGGFIIPLTYGKKADWYRNLQANGGGQLEWHGKMYDVRKAEIVDSTQALPAFPLPSRFLFWLDGIPQFVYVSQVA
jgi:deazaflavin-dependent oxidoreductase (nitroreductase family)